MANTTHKRWYDWYSLYEMHTVIAATRYMTSLTLRFRNVTIRNRNRDFIPWGKDKKDIWHQKVNKDNKYKWDN